MLYNIWKHLTLLVFYVSACHIHVRRDLWNEEGNGEMAIASLGGYTSGCRPAEWRSARPSLMSA